MPAQVFFAFHGSFAVPTALPTMPAMPSPSARIAHIEATTSR
ncbi:MAG: hypothetical protein U0166_17485 [Acidobacteriota bacterium]